jgi:Zn-dependent protease
VLRLLILGFSLLKLGKVGGTALTMLVSLAVYAGIFGWRYAAGFLGLLFIHEMGHFLAARQRGLAVGAPTFIPFVGALIELKDRPMTAEAEAYVASAGPFLGTIGAAVVYLMGREQQSGLLLAIAYSGFFLNFFNLIPLSPLDGGRITSVLSPRVWFIGVPVMLGVMIYRPSPLLVVITIAAIPALLKAWRYDPNTPENRAYYDVPVSIKVEYGVFYLGLAAFLAIMTETTGEILKGMVGE